MKMKYFVALILTLLMLAGCGGSKIVTCDGCGKDYDTVAHGRICPHCGSEKTWLITGNEINIKEITVPEES